MRASRPFSIEFFETPHGEKPVLRWVREQLTVRQRRAFGCAVYRLLQKYGVGVCDTEFWRPLGGGLCEFRLRLSARTDGDAALLRVFCHATGDRVILLLGAYDKVRDSSKRRQAREIDVARSRLAQYLARRRDADRNPKGDRAGMIYTSYLHHRDGMVA